MIKLNLSQRFSIDSFSACTLKLHLTLLWCILGFLFLCEGNLHFWNQICKCVNLGFLWQVPVLPCIRTHVSDERFIQISSSFNGYTFCAHTHGVSIQPNKPGYKVCFGRKKMEPVLKKFCVRPPRFLELDTHSYRSICRRTNRIKFAFFKFLWNLSPAWAENNPFLYSQIRPSVLFALEEISFICWDYWRVLVTVMPKSLISLTVASGDPLRWYSRFLEFSS